MQLYMGMSLSRNFSHFRIIGCCISTLDEMCVILDQGVSQWRHCEMDFILFIHIKYIYIYIYVYIIYSLAATAYIYIYMLHDSIGMSALI